MSESNGCCMFISVTKCALYCHETYILKYSLERQDEVSRYIHMWLVIGLRMGKCVFCVLCILCVFFATKPKKYGQDLMSFSQEA